MIDQNIYSIYNQGSIGLGFMLVWSDQLFSLKPTLICSAARGGKIPAEFPPGNMATLLEQW